MSVPDLPLKYMVTLGEGHGKFSWSIVCGCFSRNEIAIGPLALLLESPSVPSNLRSNDCLAIQAKIKKNGHFGGCRRETGSRNVAVTQKATF